jgi:hypothetical protein
MKYRQIGPFRTSAIAYGSMPLSIEGRPDREIAISRPSALIVGRGRDLLRSRAGEAYPGGVNGAVTEGVVFEVKGSYQANLLNAGYGAITTAISMANGVEFYLAEAEHQQYLEDNPFGYCPVHATWVIHLL